MEFVGSLAARTVVSLITAYLGAFMGTVTGSLLIPAIADGDFLPLLARMLLIGMGATVGIGIVWFNVFIDRIRTGVLLAVSLTGAIISGYIAFYWSDAFTGDSDLYIRVREITQSTIIGAVIGANVLAFIASLVAPKTWRS